MVGCVFGRAFLALCLCVLVVGCGPSNVTLQPMPHPSPVGSSPTPSSTATPGASPTASAVGSPTPSASPTATPKPTPSSTPTPTPTPTPTSSALALWGVISDTVVEFGSNQITSGTLTPYHEFSIAAPGFQEYTSMAFDRTGNMWIGEGSPTINGSGNYSGQIVEFTAAQIAALATTPNPTPHATLTIGGEVEGLAFDASGNLWASVFSYSSPLLIKLTAAQLSAGSGTPVPAITLTVSVGGMGAIAFASDGTLWSTPTALFGPSAGVVYGFAPSQLTSSGTQSPQYALTATGPPLVSAGQEAVSVTPNQLGFDAGGNLWSIFNGYTFAFAASTLHSSTAPTMTSFQGYTGQSSLGKTVVYDGYALAFDSAYDLIENSSTNTLHQYTPSQYASGATFTSATLGGTVPYSNGLFGNFVIAGPYVP